MTPGMGARKTLVRKGRGEGEKEWPHRKARGAFCKGLRRGKEGRRLQGRALRNSGVGARKTPHRLPVGTPASASPLGEGEEGRARRREFGHGGCWGWAHERKTPHRFPATTPESASPPGEGEEGAGPLEGLALRTRPWVTQRSPLGEGKNGVPLDRIGSAHSLLGLGKGFHGEREKTARRGVVWRLVAAAGF